MYVKSTNATEIRELNGTELDVVSGGSLLSAGTAGATAGATGGASSDNNFFLEAARSLASPPPYNYPSPK
jgi:hypothetical protein